MNNFPKLLTLQLRPHIAAMLEVYVEQVRSRIPENLRAKITASVVVRKLLKRTPTERAFDYINPGRRFRDGLGTQLRVRCTVAEYERANSFGVPYAQAIAALIVDAAYPGGNFPRNPDTKTETTEETTS